MCLLQKLCIQNKLYLFVTLKITLQQLIKKNHKYCIILQQMFYHSFWRLLKMFSGLVKYLFYPFR